MKTATTTPSSALVTHFVFGYGSLICPESRAITAPEQSHKIATPVSVKHVERVWSKRTARGMTAMGVRFVADAACTCIGVILPVSDAELALFDEREQGYDRKALLLSDVEQVSFLSQAHYEEDDHYIFLQAKEQNATDAIQIWVYVQRVENPASPEHPIVQTYVDTILRGCLSISEEFAHEFIASTKGWHPAELLLDDDNDDDDDDDDDDDTKSNALLSDDKQDSDMDMDSSDYEGIWVDDRHQPVYIRGDPVWSRKNSRELDQLLLEHRPDHFPNRVRLTV
jgi:cation transport regulator ChaC